MTPAQRARAQEHVAELCSKHRITARRASRWYKAVAFPLTRIIYFPPRMENETDYLVSLHEIGHVVDRRASKLWLTENQTNAILCEASAWAWAYRNVDRQACPVIPRHTRNAIAGLWSTYLPSRPNRVDA